MSIMEWFNSEPAKKFRLSMANNTRASECQHCYTEEDNNGNSRRLKSNQKSVIFTRAAFDKSFEQSPIHKHFDYSNRHQGQTQTYPIDIHIDLGNFCNLACKMCNAEASSTIASQQVKWGMIEIKKYLGTNWTKDQKVWDNFKQQILNIPGLNNIHFMGGETLLTDRLEDFVDTMIEHKRFDLCFSFVSNGTVYKPSIVDKLKKFRRVGFEISIETLDRRNSYVRQGTDTSLVLNNINLYQSQCNNTSVTLALRPAPSLLTVGSYLPLLQYALDNQLIVKSNLCTNPRFLSITQLPDYVKEIYQEQYIEFLNKLNGRSTVEDYNASDPNNCHLVVREQAQMCLTLLQSQTPSDNELQLAALVEHCQKWDSVYKLNARELYPELVAVWDKYGY
jgi:organic radical activating enzyme